MNFVHNKFGLPVLFILELKLAVITLKKTKLKYNIIKLNLNKSGIAFLSNLLSLGSNVIKKNHINYQHDSLRFYHHKMSQYCLHLFSFKTMFLGNV